MFVDDRIATGDGAADDLMLSELVFLDLADTLACLFRLKLRQIHHHVNDHSALRCGGVVGRFPDGLPVAAVPIEYVLHVQEVSEAPVQAVHFRDQNYIHLPCFDQIQHLLELVTVVLRSADSVIHKCANYRVFSLNCILIQCIKLRRDAVAFFRLLGGTDSAVEGGSHDTTSA